MELVDITYSLIKNGIVNGTLLHIYGAVLRKPTGGIYGAPLRMSREFMRPDARRNYDLLLEVARSVIAEHGAEASLREVARKAGVGIGTLYRHFPTREVLLQSLLRESFDQVTKKAEQLENTSSPDDALIAWLREMVALTHNHRGLIAAMTAALAEEDSALHASCMLRA
jgi:AcrR family transcriptional regulator